MKNLIKLLGIIALVAVIGFSMAGCGDKGGSGKTMSVSSTIGVLKITSIPIAAEGKYVMAFGGATPSYDTFLAASASASSNGNVTLAKIKGGEVTLKVWKNDTEDDDHPILSNFNGSGTFDFWVGIYEEGSMNWFDEDEPTLFWEGEGDVTFTDGMADATASDFS